MSARVRARRTAPLSMRASTLSPARMMDSLSADLGIPFRRCGALVTCTDRDGVKKLEELQQRGITNGVNGLEILTREQALKYEPGLADEVYAALYAPTSGIVCPFEMTLAFAENAAANGAEFSFSETVTAIEKGSDGIFTVTTTKASRRAKCVINAAGVYADKIHDMVCEHSFSLTARKGEYMLLDKRAGDTVGLTVFQLPTKLGKGVLVTPTVHGNLLIGPTAGDTDDREDTATTRDGIGTVKQKSALSVKDIPYGQVITSFAGLRATPDTEDFIIREDGKVKGFIDAAGIESPGLSSAPAVGEYIRDIAEKIIPLTGKSYFIPTRKGITRLASLSDEQRSELIKQRPEYGQIVCRCEQISEGEIIDCISRPLGAKTLDGVKRRVRAGMGRCQGGFCSPRVMALLSQAQGTTMEEVKKNG